MTLMRARRMKMIPLMRANTIDEMFKSYTKVKCEVFCVCVGKKFLKYRGIQSSLVESNFYRDDTRNEPCD